MIVYNSENIIRNTRPFCHPLVCHRSVVKCTYFISLTISLFMGATSSSYRGVGNFHEISFDDVIVIIQPWYNFFANGHI